MKKKTSKKTPEANPLDKVFDSWYSSEGSRFYTIKGHEEYMRYAFISGLMHGANAYASLHNSIPQPKL